MKKEKLTRLEFINTTARWLLGGVLATLVFWLWRQDRLTAACELPCSSCAVQTLCRYKRDEKEEQR